MSSILKVNQIQLSNGTTPSLGGLGISFPHSDMPSKTILQVETKMDGGVYSFQTTSYTEATTNYRITCTPKSANSTIMLEWVGLVGGNNQVQIKNAKFWDVTSNAEIGSFPNPDSRTLAHGSWRQSDNDGNDRDTQNFKSFIPSWGTTARTFTVHFKTEANGTGYLGGTITNNAGCTYVPTVITITEIAG